MAWGVFCTLNEKQAPIIPASDGVAERMLGTRDEALKRADYLTGFADVYQLGFRYYAKEVRERREWREGQKIGIMRL